MAKLTNIEHLRRRRARQKLTRNLLVLALLGAVVLTVSMVVSNLGKTELKAAVSDIKAEITSGGGYPVPLPGGRFIRMEPVGNALALQTDTHLYTYNETGRQMMNLQHGMSNVVLSASRDRLLAYDRGGTRVQMLSRSAVLQTMDTKFPIYDADLNAKGTFAVATGSDEYLAQVSVYDSELENIFNWYSAERPIISVSIADGKDAMVVGSLDVKDGVYRADIQRFQFNMDKSLAQTELEAGELLLSLDYHGGGNVRAVTDTRVILLSSELRELKEYRLQNQQLMRFEILDDGQVILITQEITGKKANTLTVLNDDLSVAAQIAAPEGLLSVDCDGQRIYLTENDKISIFKMDGTEEKVVIASGLHGSRLVAGKLYYATSAEIHLLETEEASKPGGGKHSSRPEKTESASSGKAPSDAPDQKDAASGVSQPESGQSKEEQSSSDALLVPEKSTPEPMTSQEQPAASGQITPEPTETPAGSGREDQSTLAGSIEEPADE